MLHRAVEGGLEGVVSRRLFHQRIRLLPYELGLFGQPFSGSGRLEVFCGGRAYLLNNLCVIINFTHFLFI